MNTIIDLNAAANVTFNDESNYAIVFGTNAGNTTANVDAYNSANITQQTPLNSITDAVRDLLIDVQFSNVGNVSMAYTGPYANIGILQIAPAAWRVNGIRTVNQYNEAFANVKYTDLTGASNVSPEYSYTTTVNDQSGNTRSWTTTVDVLVQPTLTVSGSLIYNEDTITPLTQVSVAVDPGSTGMFRLYANTVPTYGSMTDGVVTGNSVYIDGTATSLNSQIAAGNIKFWPASDYVSNVANAINIELKSSTTTVGTANVNIQIGSQDSEYSLTTSYNYAEDNTVQMVFDITDQDSHPNISYVSTFTQTSGPTSQFYINGVAQGVGNAAVIANTKANINVANVSFLPYPDSTANVGLAYTQVKVTPTGNITQASNVAITLVNNASHNEYVFTSSEYRSNNTDKINFEITDQAGIGTYTVTIQDVSSSLGRFYYNNAWQSGNAVTVTGSKSAVNSSVIWYEPATNYTGNVSLQYSQSKVVSGYPDPIIQANAVPITLTPFSQYTVANAYSFGNTTTTPVSLTQTLISGGNTFPESALYTVSFAQTSPTPGSNTAPSWATGTTPPANVTTWTTRTSGYAAELNDAAYNGSLYVVVGAALANSGTVRTSSDLATWTQTAAPANGLTGIIWANNQFVACGGTGIITSPNATTWTSRTSQSITKLAWNGSVYVGVGSDNRIVTSSDTITWTARTSTASFSLFDVTWGAGLFVAVGATANGAIPAIIRTSPDGITWTDRTPSASTVLRGVTWTGTQFVAVGGGAPGTGVIMSSPDGITWTTVYTASAQTLQGVAFTTGQIVVSGFQLVDGFPQDRVLSSADGGATWSSLNLGANNIGQVRAAGNALIATGGSGFLATRGADSDLNATSYTIPANSIVAINALTSTPALRYYRNAVVTGNTISLGYSLAKTRTDAGHPYQNQSIPVVTNLPITLTKT